MYNDPYSMYSRGGGYGNDSQYNNLKSRYGGFGGYDLKKNNPTSSVPRPATSALTTGGPGGPRSGAGGLNTSLPHTGPPSHTLPGGLHSHSAHNPATPQNTSLNTSLHNHNTSLLHNTSYGNPSTYGQQPYSAKDTSGYSQGYDQAKAQPKSGYPQQRDLSKDAIMKVFQKAVADENYYSSSQELDQWRPHTGNFVRQLFNDINVYDQHYSMLPPRERFNKLLHAKNAEWPERNYLQRTAIRFLTYVLEEYDRLR